MFGHVDHVGEVQEQGHHLAAMDRADSHPVADRPAVGPFGIAPVEVEPDGQPCSMASSFVQNGSSDSRRNSASAHSDTGTGSTSDDPPRLRATKGLARRHRQFAVEVRERRNPVEVGQIEELAADRGDAGPNQEAGHLARRIEADVETPVVGHGDLQRRRGIEGPLCGVGVGRLRLVVLQDTLQTEALEGPSVTNAVADSSSGCTTVVLTRPMRLGATSPSVKP